MKRTTNILCIIGPTASGKSSRAVEEAKVRGGEIVSVDSRQVYRGLDIGTEKTTREEMKGVPHHLIDIREPHESYSAGDFVTDASKLIEEIAARGNVPILAGGTHFYFDALLNGLPRPLSHRTVPYMELSAKTNEELYAEIKILDLRRALELDPNNRRRLIRALELIAAYGTVPPRTPPKESYAVEWIVINPEMEELTKRIEKRLQAALSRGLVDEVKTTRNRVGDTRLNELGLEYKIVGEYLRGELPEEKLFPKLLSRLRQYARRQKAWIRKLTTETRTRSN